MKISRAKKIMIPLGIICSVAVTQVSCYFLAASTLSLITGITLSLPILSLIGPIGTFIGAVIVGTVAYSFIHNLSKIKGKDELLDNIIDMKAYDVTYLKGKKKGDEGAIDHIVKLSSVNNEINKDTYTLVSKSEKKIIILDRCKGVENNEYYIRESNNTKKPDLMDIEKIKSIFQVKEEGELEGANVEFKEYTCNTKMSSVLAKEAVKQNSCFYGFFSS